MGLILRGKSHELVCTSAQVTYDLDSPADSWSVECEPTPSIDELQKLYEVELIFSDPNLTSNSDVTLLKGVCDVIEKSAQGGSIALSISGRDMASYLVDCCVPKTEIFCDLKKLAEDFAKPYGIKVVCEKGANRHFSFEPTTRIWDALFESAKESGYEIFFELDTLYIGKLPFNKKEYSFKLYPNLPQSSNVYSVRYRLDRANWYSQVDFITQTEKDYKLAAKKTLDFKFEGKARRLVEYLGKASSDELKKAVQTRAKDLVRNSFVVEVETSGFCDNLPIFAGRLAWLDDAALNYNDKFLVRKSAIRLSKDGVVASVELIWT